MIRISIWIQDRIGEYITPAKKEKTPPNIMLPVRKCNGKTDMVMAKHSPNAFLVIYISIFIHQRIVW